MSGDIRWTAWLVCIKGCDVKNEHKEKGSTTPHEDKEKERKHHAGCGHSYVFFVSFRPFHPTHLADKIAVFIFLVFDIFGFFRSTDSKKNDIIMNVVSRRFV